MIKRFTYSGIASNPASGINNIALSSDGGNGVTKSEMIELLNKIANASNQELLELKTDLEEIIERVTRPEYKKRISQMITAIDMAQDPRKRTKDPSTGEYDPTVQDLAKKMLEKLTHLQNEEKHEEGEMESQASHFNNREAQKKKKKTRGNPFRVLMGKVGKLLDHGVEKKDIVRYLAKQKYWSAETIERAVDIVKDYNKKKHQDKDDNAVEEEKKASAINTIKTAGYDYDTEPDFSKRSTGELVSRAYFLEDLNTYDKNTPQGDGKDAADKDGVKAELKKIKAELKNRGMDLKVLDLG
jgi:hypothetical protein